MCWNEIEWGDSFIVKKLTSCVVSPATWRRTVLIASLEASITSWRGASGHMWLLLRNARDASEVNAMHCFFDLCLLTRKVMCRSSTLEISVRNRWGKLSIPLRVPETQLLILPSPAPGKCCVPSPWIPDSLGWHGWIGFRGSIDCVINITRPPFTGTICRGLVHWLLEEWIMPLSCMQWNNALVIFRFTGSYLQGHLI